MDIARAIGPECDTRIIGIRPGEKLHECMIPADEARQTFEFERHFIIQPVQRWWTSDEPEYPETGTICPHGFSYASDNNSDWLATEELAKLIERHAPAPGQAVEKMRAAA
jgi:FlaA1/EpsC-like NDP-sugar epimerase